jgi:hypothetical protein
MPDPKGEYCNRERCPSIDDCFATIIAKTQSSKAFVPRRVKVYPGREMRSSNAGEDAIGQA